MSNNLTLGSLFSGSGGFELAGLLCGIEPLWASEIEPFPIRVTTKRLPQVRHYGDICKINGASVPPVDIITGGFCCQDLSVAGKRLGLHGERSGLFFEAVRIIREMRTATGNTKPRYAVLENVPGLYSSNKGYDFLEVLNELVKIKDETVSVPMPENGKWNTAGEIVGDGFSIAFRCIDAQFFRVPQRRRRCYIIVDFDGERAGEILFDETRLRGNSTQGGFPWQKAAGNFAAGVGGAMQCLDDSDICKAAGFCTEHSAQSRGVGFEDEISPTLRAGVVPGAVVYDARGNGSGDIINTLAGDLVRTDCAKLGVSQAQRLTRSVVLPPPTAQARREPLCRITDYTTLVMNEREHAMTVSENLANTMSASQYKGAQCILEPLTMKIRAGCVGGGKGILLQHNKSATLSTSNDQTLFEPRVYGICAQNSNSMKSDNPDSGAYEMQTARALDTSAGASGNGGTCVVALQGSVIGRKNENGPGGKGYSEDDVSFTVNTVDKGGAVAYAMTTGSFPNYGENIAPTLQARDYKDTQIVAQTRYVVRRLMPKECALLQGFDPAWCDDLSTENPTEDDLAFWTDVFNTYAEINSKKPRSHNQIIKWLHDPYTDSAEYKMWGNGICLNCAAFVLSGIVSSTQTNTIAPQ